MARKKRSSGVAGTTKTSVDILLVEDVDPLGKHSEIVRVKPGYARNFLLPQGLATVASESGRRQVQRHRQRIAERKAARLAGFKQLAESVSKYSVTLEANANTEGHLYGSIVARDVSDALKAGDYPVEPDQVRLEGPLKELGMYTVRIRLHEQVETDIKVWVVPAATA